MEYGELIDAVAVSRTLIADALSGADLDATVPTCPEFSLDRLAVHIGEFSSFWNHVVCEARGREKPAFSTDPGDQGRAAWVDTQIAQLVEVLRDAPAGSPCWTWYEPDQSTSFVASRACHELAVHRVDVQLAAHGVADAVEAPVAAAGIDEVFLMIDAFGSDGRRGTPGSGQTLHLHGTDHASAEWFVRLDPDGVRMTREHAKGDLAVRASVSDLEMILYQRPTVGDVEWFGDRSVLDAFYGEFTFG